MAFCTPRRWKIAAAVSAVLALLLYQIVNGLMHSVRYTHVHTSNQISVPSPMLLEPSPGVVPVSAPVTGLRSPVSAPAAEWSLPVPKGDMLVLHYTGAGFNNQLIQTRNALLLSKLTGRTACIPPFLKRQSDQHKPGELFFDFGDVFSLRRMNEAVSAVPAEMCAERCRREVSWVLVFCCKFDQNKLGVVGGPRYKRQVMNAVDDKVYDRYSHKEQSGFTKVQQMQMIEQGRVVLVTEDWLKWTPQRALKFFARYKGCVELLFPFPAMKMLQSPEAEQLFQKLSMSDEDEAAGDAIGGLEPRAAPATTLVGGLGAQIIGELFGARPFVAVHLRYEKQATGESRCRRYFEQVRASGGRHRRGHEDPLQHICVLVDKQVRFLPVDAVVAAIKEARDQVGEEPVYLASDIPVPELWERLQSEVGGVVSYRDTAAGEALMDQYGSDILSLVEQDICTRSALFLGTSYSTWTGTVNEWRRRDGKERDSYYLDREVLGGLEARDLAASFGVTIEQPSPSPSPSRAAPASSRGPSSSAPSRPPSSSAPSRQASSSASSRAPSSSAHSRPGGSSPYGRSGTSPGHSRPVSSSGHSRPVGSSAHSRGYGSAASRPASSSTHSRPVGSSAHSRGYGSVASRPGSSSTHSRPASGSPHTLTRRAIRN